MVTLTGAGGASHRQIHIYIGLHCKRRRGGGVLRRTHVQVLEECQVMKIKNSIRGRPFSLLIELTNAADASSD